MSLIYLHVMQSTSNYHARRYGVRAAMPGFIGKKLCPQLIIVRTHFDKYRAVSKQVREILAEYDPNYCPMSLDEAYFDLTDYLVRRQEMSSEERTFPYRSEEQCVGVNETSKELSQIPDQDRVCQAASESVGGFDDGNGTNSATTQKPDKLSSNTNTLPQESKSPSSESYAADCRHCRDPQSVSESEDETTSKEEQCKACQDSRRMRTFGVTCDEVVEEIRFRIEQRTQLTASAGRLTLSLPQACRYTESRSGAQGLVV